MVDVEEDYSEIVVGVADLQGATSGVTWWKPIKYVNRMGGWFHATANLTHEDVSASPIAYIGLQTSVISLCF